jgi:transcriptional regulator with XRE-family HTH domain
MSHRSDTNLPTGHKARSADNLDVAELRSRYGLSREKFSRLSGFSIRALAGWESGAQKPGEPAHLRLTELDRLQRGLARAMGRETMGDWLDAPNPAFDGLKPLEVIERGQVDRLWQMIFLAESGAAF